MTTTSIFWDKTAKRDGGGHAMDLPSLTCDRVQELFGYGAGMKGQRRDKYSRSLLIRLKPSNQLFSLYMCYGVWRIGFTHTVSTRIDDLVEFLCPTPAPQRQAFDYTPQGDGRSFTSHQEAA